LRCEDLGTHTGKESEAMTNLAMWGVLAMVGLASLPARGGPLLPQEAQPYGADLLARVRLAAMTVRLWRGDLEQAPCLSKKWV
jgi:hypothetical protein